MQDIPLPEFADLFRDLDETARRQGFDREVITTVAGDPVCAWHKPSRDSGAPVLYLSSGIHGDEPCGPLALLHRLSEGGFSTRFHWVVTPLLNPSGYRLQTRENASGLDLNRDFLRLQSPEASALARWWKAQNPFCFHLSFHEDWEAEGFYLYEINTSPRPSVADAILSSVEKALPLQAEGPVDGHDLTAPGLISHAAIPDDLEGWPEAIWLVHHWPVLSYTFEAPGQQKQSDRVQALLAACHGAENALIRQIEQGA